MSDLAPRAVAAVRRVTHGVFRAEHLPADPAREVELADEYAAVLGLHLSPEEQLLSFKAATDGAPLVTRPARHVGSV